VAVYVASTIAKAKPMESALHAMKLAMVAYIVPFVFVYDGALLMNGTAFEIALSFVSNVIGFIGIGIALQGHFSGPIPVWIRVVIGVAGVACLFTVIPAKAAGMAAVIVFLVWQWRVGRATRLEAAAASRQQV
jgi:TRAP-type uncharacterized transport system fused permease subunit